MNYKCDISTQVEKSVRHLTPFLFKFVKRPTNEKKKKKKKNVPVVKS